LDVLDRLVETGNTVLVIEHNLDMIRNADWIIDLGPEGGDRGGEIVAEGPPKDIAKVKTVVHGTGVKRSGSVSGQAGRPSCSRNARPQKALVGRAQ
jgi:excinuclease ABC subunit A